MRAELSLLFGFLVASACVLSVARGDCSIVGRWQNRTTLVENEGSTTVTATIQAQLTFTSNNQYAVNGSVALSVNANGNHFQCSEQGTLGGTYSYSERLEQIFLQPSSQRCSLSGTCSLLFPDLSCAQVDHDEPLLLHVQWVTCNTIMLSPNGTDVVVLTRMP